MKIVLTLGTFLLAFYSSVFAISGSQISVTNGTGPKFIIGSTCSAGPLASYLVINIKNTSSTDTLSSVKVKITSISSATSGFKLLSPSSDSIITISRILPNKSEGAYFYIQYPCSDAASATFNYSISDENPGTVSGSELMTVNQIQAAGAGGDIQSQVIVGLDALGILVADTVTYEFGNYNGGEIILQPNGDTSFKSNEVQLIGSRIISSDFDACGVKTDSTNVYYFNNSSGCGAGSGNIVKIVYFYINSLYNDTTYFFPFAAMKSGSPLKYSSNYSTQNASFGTTQNSNKVTLAKSASCGICSVGDTVTYTVTVSSSANDTIMIDELIDILPNGYSYVGFTNSSDVTKANTSIEPTNGATGTISFLGKVSDAVFPYRSYIISQNSSIELIYKAKVKGSSSSDLDTNTAIAKVGNYYLDTAIAVSCVGCPALPVTLLDFTAEQKDKGVALNWSTASEINNSHFNLFRIQNGVKTFIGSVQGHGNSSQVIQYTLFDMEANVKLGNQFIYLLEQVDFNGSTTEYYTKINIDHKPLKSILIYPNPSKDLVFLQKPNEIDEWEIILFDKHGTELYRTNSDNIKHINYIPLDLSKYANGLFHIQFNSKTLNKNFTTIKF